MKKKKSDTRKPCAMVRISPETHRRMRTHLEQTGLIQSRFVDRAILAAIPRAAKSDVVTRRKVAPRRVAAAKGEA
jgi:hypothetical protein